MMILKILFIGYIDGVLFYSRDSQDTDVYIVE